MTPNKTRTGLFETPKNQPKSEPGFGGRPLEPPKKPISVTPKLRPKIATGRSISKKEPGSRTSADQSARSVASADHSPRSVTSLDRSPKSANAKIPHFSHRSSSASDRKARAARRTDVQAELNTLKEELKAANEQLVYLEKEKADAIEELEAAKRQADEAYEKLTVAIAAKEEAEEKVEIEKFKMVELEQTGIEAARQKEESWQKEIGDIRNQHAVDVSALLATTKELERVKHDLAMATEAKNTASAHADDALKIAEIHAEKAGILSAEINRLNGLLDSKLENAAKETAEHARRLDEEIDTLRDELRRTREAERRKNELELVVKDLSGEISHARKEKSDAEASVAAWKKKAELLEVKVVEAAESERLAAESLAEAEQHLQDSNLLLEEAKSEIVRLQAKVDSMEMEVQMLKESLDQSNIKLKAERNESFELERSISSLRSMIKSLEEEQQVASDHTKQMASTIPILEDERNKLALELEASKDEVEKAQKEVEWLSSALEEANAEAQESKEQLEIKESEFADAVSQLEELKKALDSTEERCKALVSEEQCKVATLEKSIQESEMEAKNMASQRNVEEDSYVSSIQNSEVDIADIKQEMGKLASKLKASEEEVAARKEEEVQMMNRLEQATVETKSANEAADSAREESLQLKDRLLDKENALQEMARENEELRAREEEATRKISELSALLGEITLKKGKQNGGIVSKIEEDQITASKITESTGEAEAIDDYANKPELHPGKFENPHLEEQSLGELIGVSSQKLSNVQVEDKNGDGIDVDPIPFVTKQTSRTDSLDSKHETMSPNRDPSEKKKKFLSKFFKKKSQHQK